MTAASGRPGAAGTRPVSATASEPGRRAVILAAGAGSRLLDVAPVKPLALVQGRPLILHALDTLAAAGARTATVVLGHAAAEIAAVLQQAPIPVVTVHNPRWADAPNGVSLLCARSAIVPGTFLMMADHLISPELAARLVAGARHPLSLAIDRQLGHPWVDEADVTRVRTGPDGAILGIGKGLCVYDAYDTGLFLIGPELPSALDGLAAPGLSDGVRVLARAGLAGAVDIGDAAWLDVDDARAHEIAERDWASGAWAGTSWVQDRGQAA